ncbi:barstar family protein [Campylobacter sp. JMF_04 NA10]|uniref:barstar family protein n=1 Tax=Campylobacter sp. JMF_04 NA10 TaxID=2983824 RepID=UPI0022E9FCB6|nr:barstar family protein [Campylobacter sp. JMF_04 NA10]MDA3075791.1 barstar family protein [Campylobacter sp. JMF_04 NA10]
MKQITIDAAKVKSKAGLYKFIAKRLNFELDYITNLDALYDALTERREAEFIIENGQILKDKFGEFYEILLSVFEDSGVKFSVKNS